MQIVSIGKNNGKLSTIESCFLAQYLSSSVALDYFSRTGTISNMAKAGLDFDFLRFFDLHLNRVWLRRQLVCYRQTDR